MKNKARISAYRKFNVLLLVLGLLLAALVPACGRSNESSFPTLPASTTGESNPSETSLTEPTGTAQQNALTVALPVGQDAMDILRLLFLAKRSGLLSQEKGQYIGQQVQIDDLQQFNTSLEIHLMTVSLATGATSDQVKIWKAAATMPDILYSQSAAISPGLNEVQDLNGLLFDNQLLSASYIYPTVLDSCRSGQFLYGIPYLASVPMIYQNQELIEQFKLDAPAFSWSWSDLMEFSAAAQLAIDQAGLGATPEALAALADDPDAKAIQLLKAVFVCGTPVDMLSWLPASIEPTAGWAMWTGQSFAMKDPSFTAAVEWLHQYAQSGYSTVHLDAEEKLAALGTADPRLTNRVIMWTGDSSEMSSWQQSGIQVTQSLVPVAPLQAEENNTEQTEADSLLSLRTPINVRALFVSKGSQDPGMASELAAFLALDADSLLLQTRFQSFEGLVPLVQDQVVWDTMVGSQEAGRQLMILQDRLPAAYCSSQQTLSSWNKAIQASLGDFGPRILLTDDQSERAALLEQISQAAAKALQEG